MKNLVVILSLIFSGIATAQNNIIAKEKCENWATMFSLNAFDTTRQSFIYKHYGFDSADELKYFSNVSLSLLNNLKDQYCSNNELTLEGFISQFSGTKSSKGFCVNACEENTKVKDFYIRDAGRKKEACLLMCQSLVESLDIFNKGFAEGSKLAR